MKAFTATQLNKAPQEVFDAAKEDGSVLVEHGRYRGGVFAIVWNRDYSESEQLQQICEPPVRLAKLFNDDIVREDLLIGRVRLTEFETQTAVGSYSTIRVDAYCKELNEYFTHSIDASEVTDKNAFLDHCIPILKKSIELSLAASA